jgi:hypothetical protein
VRQSSGSRRALGAGIPASASDQDGNIHGVAVPRAGSIAVVLDGTRMTKPSCVTDDAWSLRSSSANSAMVLSAIITAKALGKTVHIYGTESCDPDSPTREEISYVYFD